jgi:hypothetical protein
VFTWLISSFSVSLLGLLYAEIVAKLESSTQFVIGTSNSFEVQAEGGEQFELEITSNSNVGNVEFRQEEKKVSFSVEGETGIIGEAEVTIPNAMLPGEMMMMVLIDGEVVAAESNDIIVKSNTETDAMFGITTTAASTHGRSDRQACQPHQSFRCQCL